MPIKYNIEELKKEFIGKKINWLTILDVYRNSNNRTVCKCQCKCGVIKEVLIKTIRKGRIKSCGCYHKSEEFSNKCSKWCKENPDKVVIRSEKYKQWASDNSIKVKEQAAKRGKAIKESPDLVEQYRQRMIQLNMNHNKERSKVKRVESFNEIAVKYDLRSVIHSDDLDRLLSGNLRVSDKIRAICPECGEYSYHNVRDIFNISNCTFRDLRLCKDCFTKFSSSKYENEIADFISTFYSGNLIRNSRDVISSLELDLYYPEKKIAIEFNGDYWHSEEFKLKDYHYNKFKQCLESNILLVNIFETFWNSSKDLVKSYLYDLFNGIVNNLSHIDNSYTDNNFPQPDISINTVNYIESYYTFRNCRVYTAGYSLISKI